MFTLYIDFSDTKGQVTPKSVKFELIQAFLHVLVSCKNEKSPIKNEDTRVVSTFLPLKVYGDFFRHSRTVNSAVHGRIWQNFKLIQKLMVVLVTCNNEKDPIKNEGARVVTTLYINFSDGQGQITQESMMVSSRNLNSSKLSCMSLSPARMKMIQSKMKGLEWSQHFSPL